MERWNQGHYNGGTADAGVVFKLDTTGKETVLYSFTGGSDGADPSTALILDSVGNLYGTTTYGGIANKGVVFKLDTAGHEPVVYGFTRGTDGSGPESAVIVDPAGSLYGTTFQGGTVDDGVLFKLTPAP